MFEYMWRLVMNFPTGMKVGLYFKKINLQTDILIDKLISIFIY